MPTYHVQKSRKTNNAKSKKWPKTSHWAIFFDDFEAEYLEIANFSGFIRIERQI